MARASRLYIEAIGDSNTVINKWSKDYLTLFLFVGLSKNVSKKVGEIVMESTQDGDDICYKVRLNGKVIAEDKLNNKTKEFYGKKRRRADMTTLDNKED